MVKYAFSFLFLMFFTVKVSAQAGSSIEMVEVPAGSFLMGCNSDLVNCELSERPTHKVTLKSFMIGKYPVSQKIWDMVMDDDDGGSDKSKSGISWYQAVEFCNKLSEKEGLTSVYKIDKSTKDPNNTDSYVDDLKWKVTADFTANGYRLPTESEWEYAAIGANKSKGFIYSGSNDFLEVAWCKENDDEVSKGKRNLKPNELGIFGMSGGLHELCWDWFGDYTPAAKIDPTGANSGTRRVARGGSREDAGTQTRTTLRWGVSPKVANELFGLRVVRAN